MSPREANPYGNSDILADAFQGKGGDITITTYDIFGLEERNPRTSLSDINAASRFSTSGNIILNTLDIDPIQGIIQFPVEPVNVADLVVSGCLGRNRSGVRNPSGVRDQGEFTITGRGGLSPNPNNPLSGEPTVDDLATIDPNETRSGSAAILAVPTAKPLVEAQGLARNADGKVSLVSNTATTNPNPPVSTPEECSAP